MMSHAGVVECERFPQGVPSGTAVMAAFTAESNVSSGWEAATMETKRELIQPLLSEH